MLNVETNAMAIDLNKEVSKHWGLNLETLTPMIENQKRKNIYLASDKDKEYIIKLEDLNQLEQVKVSVSLSGEILNSNVILASNFIAAKNNKKFVQVGNKIITIQVKEDVKKINSNTKKGIHELGEAVGKFHKTLLNYKNEKLVDSKFYKDFMFGDIPKAQSKIRLVEIEAFYSKYTPDYGTLTKGIVHNDLNKNNIFKVKNKYFFIDFEHLKKGPLISDIGVIVLELWDHKKGIDDYHNKLSVFLSGYTNSTELNEYDIKNIKIFSLRYLYSDENWFNYWVLKGNADEKDLITEIIEKQNILIRTIR